MPLDVAGETFCTSSEHKQKDRLTIFMRVRTTRRMARGHRMSEKFGKLFCERIVLSNRPCSYSMSAPTAVIGFVMDAMLKIMSVVLGTPAALSRQPWRRMRRACRAARSQRRRRASDHDGYVP
jgi:hypothetical protein